MQSTGPIIIASLAPLPDFQFLMKVDFLAWWGAVFGTVGSLLATFHLLWQWFVDRGRLKLDGYTMLRHTDRLEEVLVIEAVNNGRRSVRIKHVSALLTKTYVPYVPGQSPEQRAEMLKHVANVDSVKLPLFGEEQGEEAELSADGGHRVWEKPVAEGMELFSVTKRRRKHGQGCVTLTSGKKIFFSIRLYPKDNWPPFATQEAKAL